MVDEIRRKILKTGAAAAAMAAVPPVLAQQSQAAATGQFYEKGKVRIHYQEWGTWVSTAAHLRRWRPRIPKIEGLTSPFDAVGEFKNEYRCIGADLRTSTGQSSGPLDADRPWDMFADDQIGLMDHLGVDKFMVMGFCIGGPLIWNLLKHAQKPRCRCGAGAAERPPR